MARFWSVLAADRKPEAYLAAYGRTCDALLAEWIAEAGGRAKIGLETAL